MTTEVTPVGPYRTTLAAVRALLDTTDDVTAYIQIANNVTNKVADCAAGSLDTATLEIIERYLAAHYTTFAVKSVQSKSIAGGSVSYGSSSIPQHSSLNATRFGQVAKEMDTSGCLARLMSVKPQLTWLGGGADVTS